MIISDKTVSKHFCAKYGFQLVVIKTSNESIYFGKDNFASYLLGWKTPLGHYNHNQELYQDLLQTMVMIKESKPVTQSATEA